ncbi:MAG: type III-B CRISPR module RAMP protein Cmr6 [Thermomicrobium sp.]|nr:type III-B CRISPR module RAMP protein Cmr6 [Thermomicrobium sp.]
MRERPRPDQPRGNGRPPRRGGTRPPSGGRSGPPRGHDRSAGRPSGERGRSHPLLPSATRTFWNSARGQAKNPGLLFDRFAPEDAVYGDRTDATPRRDFLRTVVAAAERLSEDEFASALLARWEATVRVAGAEPFTVELESRLVTGLGAHGPLEIGFRFDRFGFPVLPGSGLKGVARAYAHLVEQRDESDPDFLAIFGRVPKSGEEHSVGRAGALVFFDAYPEPRWRLELDVMTPHYPDYYSGKAPPTPWQNPNPITFLVVAPGTRYRIAIGLRQGVADPDGRLRALATRWLREGLSQLGFGAKTTSGYGVFRRGG